MVNNDLETRYDGQYRMQWIPGISADLIRP